MGVAVISSTCGACPPAFASSWPRCSTPKRCCSSMTTTAEARELDPLLEQCVRPHHHRRLPRLHEIPDMTGRRRRLRARQQLDGDAQHPRGMRRGWRGAGARGGPSAPARRPAVRPVPRRPAPMPRRRSCRSRRRPGAAGASVSAAAGRRGWSSIAAPWSGVSSTSAPALRRIASSTDARSVESAAASTSSGSAASRPRCRRRPTMPSWSASSSSYASLRSAPSRPSNVDG